MQDELTYCDFRLSDTEDMTNVWECERCGAVQNVLGDIEPPNKVCQNPSGAPRKRGIKESLADVIQALRTQHEGLYSIEFVSSGHFFATWSPKNGLTEQSDALNHFCELRKFIFVDSSGHEVFKIPYRAWFGEELSECEYSVRAER